MSVSSFPRPAEGTWTEHYPELGTGPVSFEDSVSPAFYELERDAIFRRAWLNVGRVDDLPRNGSWFTKDLVAARTSLLVDAGHGRRGPRLPQRLPPPRQQAGVDRLAPRGGLRRRPPVRVQVPRLALRPRRRLHLRAPGGRVLRRRQGRRSASRPSTARSGPASSSSTSPTSRDQTLREYLGPMVGALEGYPFDRMTERYSFRAENRSNWKVFIDAFQEYYHVPPLHTHQLGPVAPQPRGDVRGGPLPARRAAPRREHERLAQAHVARPSTCTRARRCSAAGTRGRGTRPTSTATSPGVNPGGVDALGHRQLPGLPEPRDPRSTSATGTSATGSGRRRTTPTCSRPTSGSCPATTARERLAHEYAAITVKEYALQDAGTLDGTQLGLESRAFDDFPLNDQEILVRHFHKTVGDWVEDYRASARRPTR